MTGGHTMASLLALITAEYLTPCGKMLLAAYDDHLCCSDWYDRSSPQALIARLERHVGVPAEWGTCHVLSEAAHQLDEYFAGERTNFTLALMPLGTPFQKKVWQHLLSIPYGTTSTYAAVAVSTGHPKAARAVAGAIGANGLSIFIPCHRVIGSRGALTGYSGGLDKKRFLLRLESSAR